MKTDETQRVEVVIDSRFELIDLVNTVFEDLSFRAGFDEEAAHWMGLAVREALNNAIQHGNSRDAAKRVRIRFRVTSEEVDIRVIDQGKGFNVGNLPDPTDPANLLKPSGRGIYYIRNFMDRVEFKQIKGQGTEIRMVKKRDRVTDGRASA